MDRLWKLGVILLTMLVVASVAIAAAQPIAPAAGEVVRTSHPLFRWNLPANERSDALYVASRPNTTPEGRFFDESIEDIGVFTTDVREYSPSSPLHAGAYWWNVRSSDRDTFAGYYSSPSAFTVAAIARIHSVRARWRRFFGRELTVSVRSSANTREASVTAELRRGRRRLWRARETDDVISVGYVNTTTLSFRLSRRIKRGTRLTLRVGLAAGGARAIAVRRTRAP